MISYAIMAMAVLLGYLTTVLLSLVATIGIASGAPRFAVRDFRVRTPYKWVHELVWFLCALLGGVVASKAGMGVLVWKAELLLSGVLLLILWRNTWEARQRGTAHQIVISVATVVGVILGFVVQQRI